MARASVPRAPDSSTRSPPLLPAPLDREESPLPAFCSSCVRGRPCGCRSGQILIVDFHSKITLPDLHIGSATLEL